MFDIKKFRLGRLLLRTGGLGITVMFGIIVYGISMLFVFPFDRVGEFVEATMSNMGYDVEVGATKPLFGIGVKLEDVRVATRPTDGTKPSRFVIDKARITTSPLKNLMGGLAYDIKAEAFGGEVAVVVEADKEAGSGKALIKDISLAELPGIRESIGLPIAGTIHSEIELMLPKLRAAAADGRFEITCNDCSLGDGKAKLRVPSNPLLAEGMTMPKLRVGDLEGTIVFEKGTGLIEGMHSKSPDIELDVEGSVRLSDPVDLSQLDLYVKFKLSEKLVKSNDKFQLLLQFAEMQGKRADGFYGFRLQGSPRRLRDPQWSKTSPFPPKGQRRAPKPKAAAAALPKSNAA
ncbi:MAG: type II secretion system protein GspN [Deltaproteobacteria bacterium]|nr:type II secretion system protein GspN [Deltaproteobacteria bacterium]